MMRLVVSKSLLMSVLKWYNHMYIILKRRYIMCCKVS
jgi:hypothetical protein